MCFMLKGLVGDIKLTQYFHFSEMIKKPTCIPDQSSSLNRLMSNNGEILVHDGVYIYTYFKSKCSCACLVCIKFAQA